MRHDIAAMFWKEWREILTWGGTRGRLGVIVISVVFGVFLPLQAGHAWVSNPLYILFWIYIPFFMVSTSIVDAFAGERERHTLETLLASRLQDSAILLGKALAGATYGLAITWINLVIGLITVNIAFGAGKLVIYSLPLLATIIIFSILTSLLAAGVGILISLRAATVRQAQQTLSIGMLLLLLIPIFGSRLLTPANSVQIAQTLESLRLLPTALIAGAILLVADILLFLAALARFKRSRLILD